MTLKKIKIFLGMNFFYKIDLPRDLPSSIFLSSNIFTTQITTSLSYVVRGYNKRWKYIGDK